MLNILQRWQDLPRDDLFTFWQNEVQLRKELRRDLSEYRELKIQSKEQYDFLRLSLAYGEHRPVFLHILFYNMDSLAVQSELLQGPMHLSQEFLRFLPRMIAAENLSPQRLQFLINLYREEFADQYQEILAALGEDQCKYLLDRTANQSLRKMLKDKYSQHHQQRSGIHYGLVHEQSSNSYPSVFGDKADLLKQAVQQLTFTPADHTENLFLVLDLYLEVTEQLYMLGMLNEGLALLHLVYQQWTTGRDRMSAEDQNILYKSISRILAKTLPIYALISSSTPYRYSEYLYQRYYPELLADKNAQIYLHLYQNLQASHDSDPQYTMIEMSYICRHHEFNQAQAHKLADYFINDSVFDDNTWRNLLEEIDRDLITMPHRALTIMEILRFLARHKKIVLTKSWAGKLLQNYLSLYQWLPAAQFLNADIYDQLAPSVDGELLKQTEKMRSMASKYTRHSVRDLYQNRPDRSKDENNTVLQQMLLGSFLGVK